MHLGPDHGYWRGFLKTDAGCLKTLCRRGVFGVVASLGCLVLSSAPLQQDRAHPDEKQTASGASSSSEAKEVLPNKNDEQPAKVVSGQDERERQIAEDSAKLLKLATELKKETDKTTFDTLSLGIIRKADEIQKLAHGVRTKIKNGEALAARRNQ